MRRVTIFYRRYEVLIMVKQKHRTRRHQKDPMENCNSTDDDKDCLNSSEKTCPHITKAVNLASIKKVLKSRCLGYCQVCISANSKVAADSANSEEATVWLCLQCGNQGCDRNSPGRHALVHYETPHSDSHALVLNVAIWSIWCYVCDEEVISERNKKLTECIDYLKKNYASKMSTPEGEPISDNAVKEIATYEKPDDLANGQSNECISNKEVEQPTKKSLKFSMSSATNGPVEHSENLEKKGLVKNSSVEHQPKVKGLNNLGNTCFFNAVMQALSQTHILCQLLDLHAIKGFSVLLPGTKLELKKKELDSVIPVELPQLDIALADGGLLTQAFSSFLKEMHSFGKIKTANPGQLFGYLCKRAPQFRGALQQDSHELLRHLLDGLKSEEIRRYQAAILKAFGLSGKVNPKNVNEETAGQINAYGRLVNHTIIDRIFSGQLISTVLCEECGMFSQVFEPFLDLSLQVAEEKTLRPNIARKSVKDGPLVDTCTKSDEKMSKYQEKKTKKQLKKEAKLQRARIKHDNRRLLLNAVEENIISTQAEEEKMEIGDTSKAESQQNNSDKDTTETSDADVEDNLDNEKISTQESAPALIDGKTIDSLYQPGLYTKPLDDEPETEPRETDTQDLNSCDGSDALVHKVTNVRIRDEVIANEEIIESKEDGEMISAEWNTCDGTNEKPSGDEKCDDEPEQLKGILNVADDVRKNEQNSLIKAEWTTKSITTLSPRYQPSSHECSILSCLNQFTAPELLTGSNKFGCENCTLLKHKKISNKLKPEDKIATVYTNASKQLLISNPPAILTLHLKRFQQVGSSLSKVNRHVDFPLLLDLAPFCSSIILGLPTLKKGQKQVMYSLYGVVEHSGRLSGGHYTAYVKLRPPLKNLQNFLNLKPSSQYDINKLVDEMHRKLCSGDASGELEDCGENSKKEPASGRWFHVSDTHVSETSESSVLKCQAYLLFYERIL